MRTRGGVFAAALLYYSGLVWFARWLMQRSGKKLIILNYHRASNGDLHRHMRYLSHHYRMLHLDEALEELFASADRRKVRDRRTPLVLTFDDGYHDSYSHAFTMAKKFHVPITIFLIPGYLESGEYFWWGEGRRLVRRAQVEEVVLEGHTYLLARKSERMQLSDLIDFRLRHASSIAEREAFLRSVRDLLGVPTTVTPEEENERPVSWVEMQKMQESGLVSFGAHTMHHPVLTYLTDDAELQYEVQACRTVLEQRLGCPIRTFAYPIGRTEYIGERVLEAVRNAGYTWAVTTEHQVATPTSDPHLVGRVLGDVSRHWLVMAAETSGIWNLFSPLWKSVIGKGESA